MPFSIYYMEDEKVEVCIRYSKMLTVLNVLFFWE